ncbi:hypothetical protein FXN58_01005 [Aggregatibacter actinomycetemcomitans]|nr:hypothetical protein FXN58_01005 [Aggregatibacter actinomycetemcomitans]
MRFLKSFAFLVFIYSSIKKDAVFLTPLFSLVLFHLFPLNSTFSLAYSFFSFCSVFYNKKYFCRCLSDR